ncbi:MAG: DUF2141 domain-containing protein [Cyclobacteriaceae bacterium]
MKTVQILVILVLCLGFKVSEAQETGNLQIVISGFASIEGKIEVALYNTEENYMSKSFMAISTEVDRSEVTVNFDSIPFGEYTFSMYHDANNNGKMDTNMLGIPNEDYAFSNNANGRFGPPDYSACQFKVDQSSVSQIIKLN